MNLHYIIIKAKFALCCLLGLLPLVAAGQTTAIRQKQGKEWWMTLYDGGMSRSKSGQLYMVIPEGLSDILVMNYVDGYSVGPHAIWGHMQQDRSRWEIEETVRWAFGRETLLAKAAVRWASPVEKSTVIEVYGGCHTEDFNHDPSMHMSQSLLATGIFGWNHYKLLERTDAGIRFAVPLHNDLMLKGKIGWERRREMTNSKERNLFGAHAQDNTPRLRAPGTSSRLVCYSGPIDGQAGLLGLHIDYRPLTTRYVYDDMTCLQRSAWPTFSIDADLGFGKHDASVGGLTDRSYRYISLGAGVSQHILLSRGDDALRYDIRGGGIIKHGTLGLTDWHHLDASRFWWQRNEQLSRFVMLDNYELSTDRSWMEAHAEWSSGQMLLTQLTRSPELLTEYLQFHIVKVPTHKPHWELQYGWDLIQMWRMGVAVGFDSWTCRGAAFTMTLDLHAASAKKKKTK